MAGPGALSEFIDYAKEYYPSERYIYDHGGCWGSCRDDTNKDGSLTMSRNEKGLRYLRWG